MDTQHNNTLTLVFESAEITLDLNAFEQAIAQITSIVGKDFVVTQKTELEKTFRATIPNPKLPIALIRPGNTQEISQVIKICKQFGIHIWPVSTGKNWGYGSSTPVFDNTVIIRLDRMNRIIEVNEELAFAEIEPGVTYRQLHRYLQENCPNLWCDTTDGPPDGSVIGNALERGLGVTHYSDHFGTLCGLEVILPNGDIIKTGGGGDNCPTWHTHKWGVGPYIEGLFSQSNFGIIVKAGIWLMPKPEKFVSFTFDLYLEEDLPKLIDAVRELALLNILQSASHIVNNVVSLSILDQYPRHLIENCSCLSEELLSQLCNQHGIHKWTFGGGIQGTSAQVRLVKKELHKRLNPFGRLIFINDGLAKLAGNLAKFSKFSLIEKLASSTIKLTTGKSIKALDAVPHIHSVLKGIPSDFFVRHAYFKSHLPKPELSDPDRDNCGLIWFAPIVPMTGEYVNKVISICRPVFTIYNFDFYVALLTQNPRSMIVLMAIFFRKEDSVQSAQAIKLYTELSEVISKAGFQQYRIGVNGMLKLRERSPNFVNFLYQIKKIIDPQNILAPGKYGLWEKSE